MGVTPAGRNPPAGPTPTRALARSTKTLDVVKQVAGRLRRRGWDEEALVASDTQELRELIADLGDPKELYAVVRELYQLALWLDRNHGASQARALLDVLLPAALRLSDMTRSNPRDIVW